MGFSLPGPHAKHNKPDGRWKYPLLFLNLLHLWWFSKERMMGHTLLGTKVHFYKRKVPTSPFQCGGGGTVMEVKTASPCHLMSRWWHTNSREVKQVARSRSNVFLHSCLVTGSNWGKRSQGQESAFLAPSRSDWGGWRRDRRRALKADAGVTWLLTVTRLANHSLPLSLSPSFLKVQHPELTAPQLHQEGGVRRAWPCHSDSRCARGLSMAVAKFTQAPFSPWGHELAPCGCCNRSP